MNITIRIGAVILALSLIVVAVNQNLVLDAVLSSFSIQYQDSADRPSYVVSEVIDGDTVRLETGELVRFIGIDAPEINGGECFAINARTKTSALLLGNEVHLQGDVSDKDKYGRWLRYVWLDDIMINEELVREGYAIAKSYPPDTKYQFRLEQAQQEAEQKGAGLWAACQNVQDLSDMSIQDQDEQFDAGQDQSSCVIKGNISKYTGEKIYHIPGGDYYDDTVIEEELGEQWFCTESEAVEAGWRASKK